MYIEAYRNFKETLTLRVLFEDGPRVILYILYFIHSQNLQNV